MLRQFTFLAIWIAAVSVTDNREGLFHEESFDSTSHATPQKTNATIDFPGFGDKNEDALVIFQERRNPFPGCTKESDSVWMVCPIRENTQGSWLLQLQASGTGVLDQRDTSYSLALVYVQHEIKGAVRNVVLMFKGYATAAEQFFVEKSDATDVERFLKDNPHGFDEYKPPEDTVSTQCPARKAGNTCHAPGDNGACGEYYDCTRPGSGNGPWSCHICAVRGAGGCQPGGTRCMAPGGGSAGVFCPAHGKVEGGCEEAPKNTRNCFDKYGCTANGCAICTTRKIKTGRTTVGYMAHGPRYEVEEEIEDGCVARTDSWAACAERGT